MCSHSAAASGENLVKNANETLLNFRESDEFWSGWREHFVDVVLAM